MRRDRKKVQSNSIIVEKIVAPKISTILEFSTIMDFCVDQGNKLSRADRVYCIKCEFLFTAIAAKTLFILLLQNIKY